MKWLLLVAALSGCAQEGWTRDTLTKAGFTDVDTSAGWAPFGCGKDDSFSTHFTATNAQGQRVSGVVCCGVLKSCTVRW